MEEILIFNITNYLIDSEQSYSIDIPEYSKLLDVYYDDNSNSVKLLVKGDSATIKKTIFVKIISEDSFNYSVDDIRTIPLYDNNYEYFNKIDIFEYNTTNSSIRDVNISMMRRRYFIFIDENKSLRELRDEKLNNILNE